MLSIISFVLLISCSALAKSENDTLSVWREPEMPSHNSTLHNFMDNYGNDLSRVQPNIIFCCVCQEAVRRAKNAVIQKIQTNINNVCYKFIEAFRKICLQRAVRYRDFILHTLFPGGSPRGTCLKIKLCS